MKQFLIIGAVCSTVLVACNSANMDEITRKSNNTCFFWKNYPCRNFNACRNARDTRRKTRRTRATYFANSVWNNTYANNNKATICH